MRKFYVSLITICLLAASSNSYAQNSRGSRLIGELLFGGFSLNEISLVGVPHYKRYIKKSESQSTSNTSNTSNRTLTGSGSGVRFSNNFTDEHISIGRSVSFYQFSQNGSNRLGALNYNVHLHKKTAKSSSGSTGFYGLNLGFGFVGDALVYGRERIPSSFTKEVGLEAGFYLNKHILVAAGATLQDLSNGHAIKASTEFRVRF